MKLTRIGAGSFLMGEVRRRPSRAKFTELTLALPSPAKRKGAR